MSERRAGDSRAGGRADEPAAGSASPLTDRELEVLTHVARGLTNRQIGAALGISPMTVRNHMRTIQRKLATSDRTQTAVIAIGNGWIPIEIVLPSEGHAASPVRRAEEPERPRKLS